MRVLSIALYQNLGTGVIGNTLNVSGFPVINVGKKAWSIDQGEQLTRVKPADLTVEISDPAGTAWTFINNQLAITNGLLPPYLVFTVDGQIVYTGLVDPANIVQHLSADKMSVEIGSQSWDIQLSNSYLVPTVANPNWWQRPAPTNNTPRTSYSFNAYSAYGMMLIHGGGMNDVIFVGNATNWVSVGDQVQVTYGGSTYSLIVVNVTDSVSFDPGAIASAGYEDLRTMPGYTGTLSTITLSGSPWGNYSTSFSNGAPSTTASGISIVQHGGNYNLYSTFMQQTFTRVATSTTSIAYFTVQQTIGANPNPACYTIPLDSIEGIAIGDVQCTISGSQSATFTVLGVNPETLCITTKEAVTNLDTGDRLYFNIDTINQLVLTDAHTVLAQAMYPYSVDTSRWTPATTVNPVFGWVPLKNLIATSANLTAISDLEPTLTGCNLIGGLSNTYSGNVDAGWTATTGLTYSTLVTHADWTQQLTSAPSSLMPYEARSLSPYSRLRNRAYSSTSWLAQDNGPTPGTGTTPTVPSTWVDAWTPTIGTTIPLLVVYDYLQMRRLNMTGSTITTTAWTGSSWGSTGSLTWPSASAVRSLCNFPTGPAGALLGITTLGTLELAFMGGGGVHSCTLPQALQASELVPTPYGPYVVGPQGYGQVVYSGSTLSVNWAIFPDSVSCLWPNTFVARTSTEAFVLGRFDTQDSGGSQVTQSWSYRLMMTPPSSTTPDASIIYSELESEGVPIFVGCMRDPSKAGRLLGHFGGQVFTVDTVMPNVIERFTPGSLTAIDAIEHICQIAGCMAVPSATGTMQIISRNNSETPIALTGILKERIDNNLSWSDFYSLILVETQDGAFYAQAPDTGQTEISGGKLLTLSGHPMLWHVSQCQAIADAFYAWFGKPRQVSMQTWTYPNSTGGTPWDGLQPFALITINGSIPYRLMALENDYVNGKATVTLVAN